MSRLDISTTQVRQQCDLLTEQVRQFETLSRTMFDDGRALDRCWEGDASEQFANRTKADEPRFYELCNIVEQYCAEIRQSAADYDKTDLNSAQNIQSNTIRQSR